MAYDGLIGPVLLVEDTASLRAIYVALLRRSGLEVDSASTAAEALAAHERKRHPIVLLDLMLPDGDGIDVLRRIRDDAPDVKTIVITANGSINRAVEAMRGGAFDFLVKPFDDARLMRALRAAAVSISDTRQHPLPEPTERGFQGFVGGSEVMRAVYETLRDVGRSTASAFITGESGTGKEVCAQAIHALSPRRDKPFVPLNCGAIPRDLLESEVFGHLRGSFTGAIADKQGAAAAADGGTLFLDEICEMDVDLQTKLLRFLQTGAIQPVGATQSRRVDVRIMCATNRDPSAEVAAGRFRADLFYRLFVVPIEMPPLRARGRDVIEIAESLLLSYAHEEGKAFRKLSPEVEQAFLCHPWPGNVRELQNILRNVTVRRQGDEVTLDMLPRHFLEATQPSRWPRAGETAPTRAANVAAEGASLHNRLCSMVGETLGTVERGFIEATIEACDGSIPQAARLLGVSPSTIYRKRSGWESAAE